jgi:hypothetical protein
MTATAIELRAGTCGRQTGRDGTFCKPRARFPYGRTGSVSDEGGYDKNLREGKYHFRVLCAVDIPKLLIPPCCQNKQQ